MTDRPRVGIVGARRVGVDWHLPDIRGFRNHNLGGSDLAETEWGFAQQNIFHPAHFPSHLVLEVSRCQS